MEAGKARADLCGTPFVVLLLALLPILDLNEICLPATNALAYLVVTIRYGEKSFITLELLNKHKMTQM